MKTRKKMIAMVEIAIVLCSVFLVALPAIAADGTQKASASEVTTTSEDDYVLGVYGNANEDDTIDMRDLTYEKLIFFGKKPETELADAKYDGKINPLDFIQIKLIIVGKEKELTFVDAERESKTVSMPVTKIVVLNPDCTDAIRAIGAKDKIVGIERATAKHTKFFPKISTLPSVGIGVMPDLEKILEMKLEMNLDIVIAYAPRGYNPGHEGLEDKLEPEVSVVRLNFHKAETLKDEMLKLGYILGEVENAMKYLEWHDIYVAEIEEKVSDIPEDEKPKVLIDCGCREGSTDRIISTEVKSISQLCEKAGGRNIAVGITTPGFSPGHPYVSLEWILSQNQDVIIGGATGFNTREGGYETDDESGMKAYYDEIIGLPGFGNLIAVKDGRVYIIHHDVAYGPNYPVGLAYMAKWLHPTLFEDLDPQAIHQEYIDRFCHIDFNVYEDAVFVYPPFE